MERILKNQKVRGLFLISILVLVWCCPSDFWQRPAFGEKVKDPIMLSPQEKGSAWDLPAGVYGGDEQGGSNTDQGGSPVPGGGSNTGQGGSPVPGGGSNAGQGGSPVPGQGGDIGPGGSPRPANQ